MTVAIGLGLALSACTSQAEPPRHVTESHVPVPAPAYDGSQPPAEAVLDLVPRSATVITVTDWDRIRVQLGQPELTTESLHSDRAEFWRREETEAPALTEGMLRADQSRYELDYGFGQDDVDWEAHWTGPDGPGYALKLRPGVDLAKVQLAIRQGVGPIGDGRLEESRRLIVDGTSDVDVWGSDPTWAPLVSTDAEATYLHRGCIPLDEALGPDATTEDRDRLLAKHRINLTLRDLPGFAVQLGDHNATVRMPVDQPDLFERLHVAQDWPVADFGHAWRDGVGDPSSGRLGFTLPDPPAAVGLALNGELPFGVCNEVPSS